MSLVWVWFPGEFWWVVRDIRTSVAHGFSHQLTDAVSWALALDHELQPQWRPSFSVSIVFSLPADLGSILLAHGSKPLGSLLPVLFLIPQGSRDSTPTPPTPHQSLFFFRGLCRQTWSSLKRRDLPALACRWLDGTYRPGRAEHTLNEWMNGQVNEWMNEQPWFDQFRERPVMSIFDDLDFSSSEAA